MSHMCPITSGAEAVAEQQQRRRGSSSPHLLQRRRRLTGSIGCMKSSESADRVSAARSRLL